ncbi:hypothetical protein GIB67_010646, partial [Kingdonia uniflora]
LSDTTATSTSSGFGNGGVFFPTNSVDCPSLQITTVKLDGSNYPVWAQSAKLAIVGRGKINFITSTKDPPIVTDPTYAKWMADNAIVISWLIHSMQPSISVGYMFMKTAKQTGTP